MTTDLKKCALVHSVPNLLLRKHSRTFQNPQNVFLSARQNWRETTGLCFKASLVTYMLAANVSKYIYRVLKNQVTRCQFLSKH